MPIKSRWTQPVPKSSLQKWIFGSSFEPLSDRKAFIDADRPETHFLTFANYRLMAKQLAIGLQAAGLKPGDRVLLFSGNNVFFPVVFIGILMAGGIFTGANPGFVPRELAYQLTDSGATFMIAAEGSLDAALEAAKQAGLPASKVYVFDTTVPGSGIPEKPARDGARHWTDLIAPRNLAKKFDWAEPADPQTTTCCLNYSSGTTGVPKGVEISHYSYVANGVGVVSVSYLQDDFAEKVKKFSGLCFLPLYHAYAQTYFVANYARMGIPVYIMPQFDFVKMLTHIQTYRITNLTLVPPVVVAMAKHPITKKFDLSSIEQIGCGAAPLAGEVARELERILNKDEKDELLLRQGWGMTEITCTAMTWDPRVRVRSAAVGEMMPNCAAKLMNLEGTKEITKANSPGELWVAGPTVMRGYWHNPKATNDTMVIDPDGTRWLRTGDIAYVEKYEPGGIFNIVDRLKELIKVKGNQVAPAELEALLLENKNVADAAVVGVSIKGEEYPRAYIVKGGGSKASEQDIAKWLEDKVSKHKRLRGGVVFIDAIPKNPSGKILRKVLRDLASKEVGDKKPQPSKLS